MNIYDLWYSTVKLPNEVKRKVIADFKSTEELWLAVKEHEYSLDSRILKQLLSAMDKEKLEVIINKIEKNNIKYIKLSSEKYPTLLKDYEDSPYLLYYVGDIGRVNSSKTVAIVGSRQCSSYGREVAKKISSELVMHNINIVSGMAKGIDSIAHWGAINNNGFTAAVLGCGVDRIYPAENRDLYNKIKEEGCILSEFLPGTPPFAYNFPIRNRIISGMSDLIIVVEAAEKSGSLITASRALDQGKQVMAVPGSVFSEKSKETNKLIRDGAFVFTGIDSILNLLDIRYNHQEKSINSINYPGEMGKIYNILTETPMHVDDIIRITNIDISLLYELLLEMQLEDSIRCIAGNFYVKVNEEF